jgi:hypothetical protein
MVNGCRRVSLTTSPSFVSLVSRKCGNLDFSQHYGLPVTVTGIALTFPLQGLYDRYEQMFYPNTFTVDLTTQFNFNSLIRFRH